MKVIKYALTNITTGIGYIHGLIVWSIIWLLPLGFIHIITLLIWELPYLVPSIVSHTWFNILLIIKILILAYPISTLSPWSMLKATFGGLLLFIIIIFSLNFLPPNIALKNILLDVGLTSKAYTVFIYLLLSNLLIPIVAKEDLENYHFLYMALGIDEIITVLSRTYIHFSIPAIIITAIGIATLLKQRKFIRGAEKW